VARRRGLARRAAKLRDATRYQIVWASEIADPRQRLDHCRECGLREPRHHIGCPNHPFNKFRGDRGA
jgi:hypothetical protein